MIRQIEEDKALDNEVNTTKFKRAVKIAKKKGDKVKDVIYIVDTLGKGWGISLIQVGLDRI